MTEADKAAMEEHGITCERKDVFFYNGYEYERLADAVRYAQLNGQRDQETSTG